MPTFWHIPPHWIQSETTWWFGNIPSRRFHRPTWMALLDQTGLTPESTTVSYNDGSNVRRFKGSSSLKKSQVYPSKFGRAVRDLANKVWPAVGTACIVPTYWFQNGRGMYNIYSVIILSEHSHCFQPVRFHVSPATAKVAREFDLRSQQYGLDKRRFEINYAPDPWDDAKYLGCIWIRTGHDWTVSQYKHFNPVRTFWTFSWPHG